MSKTLERLTENDIDLDFDISAFEPGVTRDNSHTIFKLFCPRSPRVQLVLFDSYEANESVRFDMSSNADGFWYICIDKDLEGSYYGFDVTAPTDHGKDFLASDHLIADPYSKWVTVRNNHRQEPLTKIVDTSYDWEGDSYIDISRDSDLIIYESHLKDMTIHPSAESDNPGTYRGFVDPGQTGGIAHLKQMGVNAVEFLPLQKYAYFEPPYQKMTEEGIRNHWNPYARNHWGYMTSFFFAPESRFAREGSIEPGAVCGREANAINEFKDMVKALHREGIAVIMDVVYNHVSQYDWNPLKYLDKEYYFRLNEHGEHQSYSGCGNDFKTESPQARKLIVDSIKYWMEDFHIDGFRFDLAPMIDWETMEAIRNTALSINPNAVLIAEPWGPRYDPNGYSDREIGAWNDKIRNGVKGSHPIDDPGFITGDWQYETSREVLENLIMGTLEHHPNGLFNDTEHSINYLESHDGYTLGDFIRINQNPELINRKVQDQTNHLLFSSDELRIAKLGALFLFVSQGVVMLHEGQEWGRSKVIAESNAKDYNIGKIDHDSYNKDNATNHLDFGELSVNSNLSAYYRGLIALRKQAPSLRRSAESSISFTDYEDPLHLSFYINGTPVDDSFDYFVSLNGNRESSAEGSLPDGTWQLVVNEDQAGVETIKEQTGNFELHPTTGKVFRRPLQ